MKSIYTLVFVTTLIVLAGCTSISRHSFAKDLSRLNLGMSKDEVGQILGAPSNIGTGVRYGSPAMQMISGFSEVFFYSRTSKGKEGAWIVVFVDGKVTEYGPFVGSLHERYGSIFPSE